MLLSPPTKSKLQGKVDTCHSERSEESLKSLEGWKSEFFVPLVHEKEILLKEYKNQNNEPQYIGELEHLKILLNRG